MNNNKDENQYIINWIATKANHNETTIFKPDTIQTAFIVIQNDISLNNIQEIKKFTCHFLSSIGKTKLSNSLRQFRKRQMDKFNKLHSHHIIFDNEAEQMIKKVMNTQNLTRNEAVNYMVKNHTACDE